MPAPDPYLDADAVRALWPVLADDEVHTDEAIEALVAEFESIAERARGVAYREREATITKRARCVGGLMLDHRMVSSVDEVSVNDTALDDATVAEIEAERIDDDIVGGPWSVGDRVTVTYTYGFTEPPPSITRACGEFVRAKRLAATSNAPRNTLSYQDDSGYTYRESTADWNAGRYTGLMVVDDAINSVRDYRYSGVS